MVITKSLSQFVSIDEKKLSCIGGGVVGWVIAGTVIYGMIAGYTDEKCAMDKGKHWYCTKLN